ncbi:hypothetical protein INT45_001439 [Circinella minor]|uniref:Uncharacterized protein n=1 Tax=Circinella minor TaxID=1195481 RepID=A0A8H7VBD3_9FUNG|nr:hypothetical protein INT45_001439 [Circinella minor]
MDVIWGGKELRVFCSDKAVAAHEIAVHKDELYPSTAFSLKSEAITCEPDKTDVPYENDQVTNRETIFVCDFDAFIDDDYDYDLVDPSTHISPTLNEQGPMLAITESTSTMTEETDTDIMTSPLEKEPLGSDIYSEVVDFQRDSGLNWNMQS